jgi:hypothetical protein
MRLDARSGRFLIGVAVWNAITWSVFIKNLWFNGPRTHPTGYYVAHTMLIVVNLLIAAVLAPLGWRALRDSRAQ